MTKKATTPNPFTGHWRIVSMSQWDQDFVDEEEGGAISGSEARTSVSFTSATFANPVFRVRLTSSNDH